ncbi:hypothetical protein MLD38_004125 [Melastoma candidum]|uniref:Uncharacterized protein n=1 Tax=Melastoma candidum TaxID=119954 RepID=A0ACB9S691_9MYRT|nr:hypothetical protein MLD38_004125 [Melastoma candidum]
MFVKPKILLLNIELELKSEKENAEIRLSNPSNTGGIVDSFANLVWEPADVQISSINAATEATCLVLSIVGECTRGSRCQCHDGRQRPWTWRPWNKKDRIYKEVAYCIDDLFQSVHALFSRREMR